MVRSFYPRSLTLARRASALACPGHRICFRGPLSPAGVTRPRALFGLRPCPRGSCPSRDQRTGPSFCQSIISPDQQFQAGLFCGAVHSTQTTPLSSGLGTNLCPASQYGSTLITIPAPGTKDDDHNPPRIAPRHLFDLAIGDDDLFHGDKRKWSAQVTVINLNDKAALYNFSQLSAEPTT
jgi:hypothetical protein